MATTHEAVWVQVTIPDDKIDEFLKVPCRHRLSASLEGRSHHAMPRSLTSAGDTDPRHVCR